MYEKVIPRSLFQFIVLSVDDVAWYVIIFLEVA